METTSGIHTGSIAAKSSNVFLPFPGWPGRVYPVPENVSRTFGPAVLNYYWDGQDIKFGMGKSDSSKPIGWSLVNVLHHLGVPLKN